MGKVSVRLPAYVTRVKLASGEHAYYWKLPHWATVKDPKTGERHPAERHGFPCPSSPARWARATTWPCRRRRG